MLLWLESLFERLTSTALCGGEILTNRKSLVKVKYTNDPPVDSSIMDKNEKCMSIYV